MITDRTVIYSLIEKALETDRERSGGGQSDISSSMAATGEKCHNIQPTVPVKVKTSFPKGGESYAIISSLAQLALSILFSTLWIQLAILHIRKHTSVHTKDFAASCITFPS